MKFALIAAAAVAAMSFSSVASAQTFSSPEISLEVGGKGGLTAGAQAGVAFGELEGYAYGETMLGNLNQPLNFEIGLGAGYDLGTKTAFGKEAEVSLDVYGGVAHISIPDYGITYGVVGAEAEAHPGIIGGEFIYGSAKGAIGFGAISSVSVSVRAGVGYEYDVTEDFSVYGSFGCMGSVSPVIGLGCGELKIGATYKF